MSAKTKIIICTRIRLDANSESLEPEDRGFRQECFSWHSDDMLTGNFWLVLFQSSLFIGSLRGFLDKYQEQLLDTFPEDKVYHSPKGWTDQSERMFLQGYAAGLYKFPDVHGYIVTDPNDEYYRTIHIIDLDHVDGNRVVRTQNITAEAATGLRVKFGQATTFEGRKVAAQEHSSTIPDGDPEEHNIDPKTGKKLDLTRKPPK